MRAVKDISYSISLRAVCTLYNAVLRFAHASTPAGLNSEKAAWCLQQLAQKSLINFFKLILPTAFDC